MLLLVCASICFDYLTENIVFALRRRHFGNKNEANNSLAASLIENQILK